MCALTAEGGLGICSIRLTNASFICKLAWDIITSSDDQTRLLRERYFTTDGQPRGVHRRSSIRSALYAHAQRIQEGSYWLIGRNSKVKFWTDNWLGYRIADRLSIPPDVLADLECTVGDYFVDGVWYFTTLFITRHLDVVFDILQTPIHGYSYC